MILQCSCIYLSFTCLLPAFYLPLKIPCFRPVIYSYFTVCSFSGVTSYLCNQLPADHYDIDCHLFLTTIASSCPCKKRCALRCERNHKSTTFSQLGSFIKLKSNWKDLWQKQFSVADRAKLFIYGLIFQFNKHINAWIGNTTSSYR